MENKNQENKKVILTRYDNVKKICGQGGWGGS